MAKKVEERFEIVEQGRFTTAARTRGKVIETHRKDGLQNENNLQHQQLMLKYMEGLMKEQSTITRESGGSSSKPKTKGSELIEEAKVNEKEDDEKSNDRNKFKEVEMPVFIGRDPDSWLFRVDQYFKSIN